VILEFIGISVYLANNAAIPMFVLSGKYAAAATDAQRSLLLAAGQAVLTRGEDFTPGAFLAFLFLGIAGVAISWVMLRSGIFGKAASYTGILGTKDNLIRECVQRVIGQLFGSVAEVSEALSQLQPVDKLKS